MKKNHQVCGQSFVSADNSRNHPRLASIESLERRQLLTTYNLTSVASFVPYPNGQDPTSQLVSDTQGNLYGTTSLGGTNGLGTVYEIAAGTKSFSTLASLPGTALAGGGSNSSQLSIDSKGNLFGTSYGGGTSNDGIVFEVAAGTHAFSTVAQFPASDNDYAAPVTLDSAGDIYGTSPVGTVFEIRAGTSSLTTLGTFTSASGANFKSKMVLDSSGDLFGTTLFGGTSGAGAIFEVPAGSGSVVVLASFTASTGEYPGTDLVRDSAGNLYGTTTAGGSGNEGTVFKLAAGSSTITVLNSFTGSNGAQGAGGLIADASGNLYGTTIFGGSVNQGTVFKIAAGTSTVTTLASFDGDDGGSPEATVTMDSAGNLFGTTLGSHDGAGMAFELPVGSSVISDIHEFTASQGGNPSGDVVFDSKGNLFGATTGGGVGSQSGTLYEIAAGTESITTLVSFSNFFQPQSLSMNASGTLFGTGTYAGAYGAVFEFTPGKSSSPTLIPFTGGSNGEFPSSYLSIDAQGNVFGTTTDAGANGAGTTFEIRAGSTSITTLAPFSKYPGFTTLPNPVGGVIVDARDNLYGVTQQGGSVQDGTLYELPVGTASIVTLATFGSASGTMPSTQLTRDANGNLFGTTTAGGTSNDGTIFELASGSTSITTLANFNISTTVPTSGVTEDNQGNFFGVAAYNGGSTDTGIFELTAGSNSIGLGATLQPVNGIDPTGNLEFDASGNLYGTTAAGGTANGGEVYELVALAPSTITLTSPANGSVTTSLTPPFSGVAGIRSADSKLAIVQVFAGTSITGKSAEGLYTDVNPATGAYSVSGSTPLPPGVYTAEASEMDSNYEITYTPPVTFTIAPDVAGFTVDNGTAQRSMIRTLTVSFTAAVTLDSGAITLINTTAGGSKPVNFTAASSDGGLTYTITPTSGTASGGSLSDGSYSLTVHASGVHASANTAIAAATDHTYTFFRLFGDSNGDGIVNLTDYRAFASAYLKSSGVVGYNAAFDANSDGTINLIDYRAFAANYLRSLTG